MLSHSLWFLSYFSKWQLLCVINQSTVLLLHPCEIVIFCGHSLLSPPDAALLGMLLCHQLM